MPSSTRAALALAAAAFDRVASAARAASSSSSAARLSARRALSSSSSSSSSDPSEIARSIEETIARTGATPPERLRELLGVLRARGHALVLPTARFEDEDAHPLVVPIARARRDALNDDDGDGTIGLLLRPSTVTGAVPKTLPVVRCGPGGIDLLSLDASSHVHRALVEEDAEKTGGAAASDADADADADDDDDADDDADDARTAAGAFGASLYVPGTLAASSSRDRPDVFVHRNVAGRFPEIMERLARAHERKGDALSHLVTCEWYGACAAFAGWGRPQAFNARALLKHGRAAEARDAARVSLASSPWYTIGRRRGGAREMLEISGLAAAAEAKRWNARDLRRMLETGGEAHEAAARAMMAGAMGDGGGDGEEGEKEKEKGKKNDDAFVAAMRAAESAMDATALGLDADGGDGLAWADARADVAAAYDDAGLSPLASFVRGGGSRRV
jgi:hypothetical protein